MATVGAIGVGIGVGLGEGLGVGVGLGVGEVVGVGAGVEALMLSTCIVVSYVLSPIAPEANVESVVVKTRTLFTYSVIELP
jgi:hypothetical protein